jgi:hypothetical protein
MTEIAIVILNWNTRDYLEKFLPVLIKNSKGEGNEIYVADNGSEDDSVEFLKANYPDVHLIQFDRNYGFTGGYNKALEQIEAKYYLLLNSDIEVTPNWLAPLKKMMDEDKGIGACMPKIKAYHDSAYFEYAGAAGGFIDKYGYPFCRGRIMNVFEKDEGQYDNKSEIFWATGACMMVRADLFHETGGFDNDFFAHMEEIDLCWRMKNRGFKIMYEPNSVIYHIGGGTLPNESPFKLYLNYRNNLFLLIKNLPPKYIGSILRKRFIIDMMSAVFYLVKGQFNKMNSVFKAYRQFRRSRKEMLNKRSAFEENQKSLHATIFKQSIIFVFFFKRKKYFKDLNADSFN